MLYKSKKPLIIVIMSTSCDTVELIERRERVNDKLITALRKVNKQYLKVIEYENENDTLGQKYAHIDLDKYFKEFYDTVDECITDNKKNVETNKEVISRSINILKSGNNLPCTAINKSKFSQDLMLSISNMVLDIII